ncbi:cadherin-like domain-containing protein [Geminocystis sp. NIES-3709]|uniref:cadherin-like domain-containing protein n=1 Tax=Geminocystis sp. NIES-3709 TaxID=1617448 RepID=UPI0005FC4681|nr:cadherin-like domain-containing protein [Geminocystis sp. NIES-3709]BAQ64025.1 alkaline phosphatase [Geminocystis sp. NIES-3709]
MTISINDTNLFVYTFNEDTLLSFSTLNISGAVNPITITLSVSNGSISLGTLTGLTITQNNGTTIEFSGNQTDVNTALQSLIYDPNSNYNGSASLNITADDGFTNANQGVDLTINPVNDAPVLTPHGTFNLTVDEDTLPVGVVGSLVSNFTTNISDVDAGALQGIAITAVSPNVTLYYSLNNGTTWLSATGISESNALLLDENDRVYLLNNTINFNGSINNGLTFRGWDQTIGTNGSFADTTINGNETPFSIATDTIDITVNPVNDAPTRIGGMEAPDLTPILTEDQDSSSILGDTIDNLFNGKFSDIDGNNLAGIAVVANGSSFFEGEWQWSDNNGISWTTIESTIGLTNALVLNKDSLIRFVPFTHFNGSPDPLTVRLIDDSVALSVSWGDRVDLSDPNNSGGTNPYSNSDNEVTITTFINGVNDAPRVFGEGPVTLNPVNEDSLNPSGETVFNLFDSRFSDSTDSNTFYGGTSSDELAGVAIVQNTSVVSQGKWQYFNGTWIDIDNDLGNDKALVLDKNTLIRFLPTSDFNGTPGNLTVRLIEDSQGAVTTGTILDFNVTPSGDTTIYSNEDNVIVLNTSINAINDAPTRDITKPNLILLADEDSTGSGQATVITLFGAGFQDKADAQIQNGGVSIADEFTGVAIVQNEANLNGTWQWFNGTTWIAIPTNLTTTNALVLDKDTPVRFVINTPDFNGDIGKLTARLLDDSLGAVVSGNTLNVSGNNGTEIYSNSSNQVLLFGSITPINDSPTINPSALVVDEGGQGSFSNSGNFNLVDIDNVEQQLIIKIDSLPSRGILTFNGIQVVVGSTFSADQISQLRYQHNGSQVLSTTSDSFNVTVEDGAGGSIASTTIPITISPVNQLPTAVAQQTLYEGETGVTIPINITDPDQDGGTPHNLKILTLPDRGTLKVNGIAINSVPLGGLTILSTDVITYDHDGNDLNNGNPPNESFDIEVIDDGGGTGIPETTISTIDLNIIPNNDDPFLINNTGTTLNNGTGRQVTITPSMLQVSDPDSSVTQLTYTLTDIPNDGYLLYNDNGIEKRLLLGATFTQQDLNLGNIRYRFFQSGAGVFNDSFSFQVRDSEITAYPTLREGGIYNGNILETITFPITIETDTDRGSGENGENFPPRDQSQPPIVDTNTGIGITINTVSLNEESSITITNSLLKVTDPDNPPSEEIILRISELPTSGILRLNGVALRVYDSFTQKDIDDGLLTFDHAGDEDFIDNFKFTVSDGSNVVTNNGSSFIFNIDVTPQNDSPNINISGKPFVREGGTTGINPDSSLNTYLSLSDVDGTGEKQGIGFATPNSLTFQIIDLPTYGYLEVDQGSGFVQITDLNKSSINITQAQLNSNLFRYVHDGSENFNDSFNIQANDNTGEANALSAVTTVEIDIAPINDSPIFQEKKDLIVLEGATATIKGSNGILGDESRLIYQDSDNTTIQRQYVIAPNGNVKYGTLFLNGLALGVGSAFTQGDLDNDRVTYKHDGSENHDDEFFFIVRDGAGGSINGDYQITVNPRNDVPTLTIPGVQDFFGNTPINITGIIPDDIDLLNLNTSVVSSPEVDRLRITLNPQLIAGITYPNGALTLNTTTGITFINPTTGLPYPDQNVTNNGIFGNKLVIEGTLADLLNALNTVNSLQYQVNTDVNGTISLGVTVDDRLYDPNTGVVTSANGGTQNQNGSGLSFQENTITRNVLIRTSNLNDAPEVITSNNSSFAFLTEDQTSSFTGKNGNPPQISIKDLDAFDSNNNTVTLTVSTGAINLTNTSLITGGANGTDTIVLTGTITQINQVLAGFSYTPSTDYNNYLNSFNFSNPPATLTIVANDNGNSGEGGVKETTRIINLLVRPVNDAPTRIDAIPVTSVIPEDTTPTGNTVFNLFNPKFSDERDNQTANQGSSPNTLSGVAIVGNSSNNPSQGKWQWSVNETLWTDISTSLSLNNALILANNALIRFLPAVDFHGTPMGELTTRLIDSSGTVISSGGFMNLSGANATGGTTRYSDINNQVILQPSVSPVNDAPVATSGIVSIATISEDTTNPSGTQLLGLLNSQYDDSKDDQTINNGDDDETPLSYVAIVGSTNYVIEQGKWQYSDGLGGWTDIPVNGLSNSSALIIPSDRQIRFLPESDFFGNPGTLTVKLADGSSVLNPSTNSNDLKNLTSNGGIGNTGSWSINNVTIASNPITNVNDAPIINNPLISANLTAVDEDTINPSGATITTLFGSKYNDTTDDQTNITGGGDADTTFSGIAIVGNTSISSQGTWEYNTGSSGWVALPNGLDDTNALVLNPNTQLRFVPALNYYGNPGELTIRVSDGNGFTAGIGQNITGNIGGTGGWSGDTTTLATTINSINDAPVLNGTAGAVQTTVEDALAIQVGLNLTSISDIEIGLNQLPDLVTATVTIGDFFTGDQLAFTLPSGVNVSVNGTGDVYTLSGTSATLANILSALQSTTYVSVSDNPTNIVGGIELNPSRNIQYQINDTQSNNNLSNVISTTVEFTQVFNDAPSLANASFSINEDPSTNNGQTINTLFNGLFSDPDGPTAFLSGLAIIGNTANSATEGTWEYSTNSGTNWFAIDVVNDMGNALGLSANTLIRFVPVQDYNGTPSPLQVRALDDTYNSGFTSNNTRVTINTNNRGGETAIAANPTNLTVVVNPVNDAPIISGITGTTTYTENTTGITLITGSSVIDVDANNFNGGNVTFSLGSYLSSDRLRVRNQGTGVGQIGVSGSNISYQGTNIGTTSGGNGADLIITLNNSATKQAVQALLENLIYSNNGDNPTNAGALPTRTFNIRLNDGGNIGSGGALNSNILNGTINVIAINDAPVNNLQSATQTINEDTTRVFNATNSNRITISDADAGSLVVQVTLTATNGLISLPSITGLTFTTGDGTNDSTMTFTGTITTINNRLNGLSFAPTPNYNNNFSTGSITITTDDLGNTDALPNQNQTDTDTVTINITPVNDTPVISLIASPVTGTYTEGLTSFNVGQNIASIADIEIDQNEPNVANNFTATVTITDFFTGDVLDFTVGSTGVVVNNQGNGIYTVTGTKANVLQVLQTTNYSSTSENPSNYNTNLDRVITYRINDNQLANNLSNTVSTTVNITPVNDPPTVSASNGVTTFTEGNNVLSTPIIVDGSLTLDDVDNLTLASATLSITNFLPEDILVFNNNPSFGNITGNYVNGVLSLTSVGQTATLAQWQNALRSVTYTNSSEIPSNVDRVISIVVNDGSATSNITTKTVQVLPVNDTPILGTGSNINYLENASPVAIAPTMTLTNTDTDLLDYNNGSSLTIVYTSGVTVNDQLSILQANGITVIGNEIRYNGNAIGTFSGGGNGTDLSITFNGIDSTAVAVQQLLNNISFNNTSDDPVGGNRVFNIIINDNEGGLQTATSSTTVNVIPLNDAPSFTGNSVLTSIQEDQVNNTIQGETINNLFGGLFSDADISTASFNGIAVVGNTANSLTEGTWQYSTNGINWFNIGVVNDGTNAISLSTITQLRFIPIPDYNGNPTPLEVRALDNTYVSGFTNGAVRVNIDTTTNGGTTPIAGSTNILETTVIPVNDTPTLAIPGTQTLDSGTNITFSDSNAQPNGITIDDMVDLLYGGNNDFTMTLTVTKNGNPDGSLTLNNPLLYPSLIISGNNSSSITLRGTKEDINSVIDGLSYSPSNSNSEQSAILDITVFDNANGGIAIGGFGNGITVNKQIIINVSNINEPSDIISPLAITAIEDTPFNFSGINSISFDDRDDFGQELEVTLSLVDQNSTLTNNGIFTLSNINGLTVVNGNGSNFVTLRGAETDLNNALASLIYQGSQDYNTTNGGNNRLKIVIDDLGNTGQSPLGSTTNLVTREINITVTPVNDAPIASGSPQIDPVLQTNTNPPGALIGTLLQPNYDDSADNQISNQGSSSTAFAGIAIVGNTANASTQGVWQYAIASSSTVWYNIPTTLSNISALVLSRNAKIRFKPNPDFSGTPAPLQVHLADSYQPIPLSANTNISNLKDLSIVGGSSIWSANTIDISAVITEVNAPPIIDNLEGDAVSILPGGTTVIDQGGDAIMFDRQGLKSGGIFTVSLGGIGVSSGDTLSFGSGVSVTGNTLSIGGFDIGSIDLVNNGEDGKPLVINFTKDLSDTEADTLIQNINFTASNNLGIRSISFNVTDGDTLDSPNLRSNTAIAFVHVGNTPIIYDSTMEGDINNQVRSDILKGTNPSQKINGITVNGNDLIYGKGANDILYGYKGDDLMIGGDGNDTVDASDGNDILLGSSGNDLLNGGNGDDLLFGGDDNDSLNGGAGNDYMSGGLGRDTLTGSTGTDQYDYRNYQDSLFGPTTTQPMYDLIMDFNVTHGDKILTDNSITGLIKFNQNSQLIMSGNVLNVSSINNALSTTAFGLDTAALLRLGTTTRYFLAIDHDGISGFDAEKDSLMEIRTTGSTIAVTHNNFNHNIFHSF